MNRLVLPNAFISMLVAVFVSAWMVSGLHSGLSSRVGYLVSYGSSVPPRTHVQSRLFSTRQDRDPVASRRLKYAILVDAENAQAQNLPAILEELVALYGDAVVRRVYGDFTKPQLMAWKETSLALSFIPVNAYSYVSGKGTSDSAMIIEAMELLFTNPAIDGFVLVSSDSDFTRLAQRLREAGKHIIGFGETKTPAPFVTACERFIYTENLGGVPASVSGSEGEPTGPEQRIGKTELPKQIVKRLNQVIDDTCGEDGWARLSECGTALIALESDFDVRSFGYKKLSQLILDNPQYFVLETTESTVRIRRVNE